MPAFDDFEIPKGESKWTEYSSNKIYNYIVLMSIRFQIRCKTATQLSVKITYPDETQTLSSVTVA